MIPYAARDLPFLNPRLRKGDRLPNWMRHDGMLNFVRRWCGRDAVSFAACANAPAPPGTEAPTAGQDDDEAWREFGRRLEDYR